MNCEATGLMNAVSDGAQWLGRRLRTGLRSPWVIVPVCIFTFAHQPESHAEEYRWQGGSGTWSTGPSSWLDSQSVLRPWPGIGIDVDALFLGSTGTLTLGMDIRVNDITVTGNATYSISGAPTLFLEGETLPEIDITTGSSFTINSTVEAAAGFSKLGGGTLILASNSSRLSDQISVNAGTLQIGLSTSAGPNLALRRADLVIGTGATVRSLGSSATAANLWTGSLSGAGTVTTRQGATTTYGAQIISLFKDARFDGTLITGGLRLQGAGVQHFAGNVGGVTLMRTIDTGAGMRLSGSGGNGVLPDGSFSLRGGSLTLDNSVTTTGRVEGSVTMRGSRLTFIGNAASTLEGLGALDLANGYSAIEVMANISAPSTLLIFSNLTIGNTGTVDFQSGNSILTSGTNAPVRINIASPPSSTNGILGLGSAGAGSIGYATVNGRNFAGYSGTSSTGGVVEIAPVAFSPTLTGSANALLDSSATIAANTASFHINSLTMAPTQPGQSLEITGVWNLRTSAFLLRGANTDFEIKHTGTGGIGGDNVRVFHVPEPSSTLLISASLAVSSSGVIKAGEGLLSLTANNSALLAALTINSGIVRSEMAKLPGGPLQLRGGILELKGGSNNLGTAADFKRPLGSGNGAVNWANGTSDYGEGGFSAFGGNATINIGGFATPSPLIWATDGFVPDGFALMLGSIRADSRITMLNPVALDNGFSSSTYNLRTIRVLGNPTSTTDVARLAGAISGSANSDFLKTGDGSLQLTGTNDYTGQTIIRAGELQIGASDGAGAGNGRLAATQRIIVHEGGSLLLGGAGSFRDRIHDAAPITLDGGTLKTNGLSEYNTGGSGEVLPGVGALTLLSHSILDFGGGASTFAFGDSSRSTWNGTLSIYNWGEGDRLFFGIDALGLTPSQIARIEFYAGIGTGAFPPPSMSSDGGLTIVPEPSTALTAGALLLYLGSRHRRPSRARVG